MLRSNKSFAVLASVMLSVLVCQSASGAIISSFFDNFEVNLAKWTPTSGPPLYLGTPGGYITTDPLNPSSGNDVLSFSATGSGGSIFAIDQVATTTGFYTLSFDYLGVGQGGGFLGVNATDRGETWIFGDNSYGGRLFTLINDGAWHHYSVTLTTAQVGNNLTLKLEDFVSPASNAYFDNVSLRASSAPDPFASATTPEPASCVIWGALGIAGLVAARRRKKVAA